MTEMIAFLYPVALDSKISASEFWNSSPAEISDAIESYNRRKKEKIRLVFMKAEVIINRLLYGIDQNTKLLMPWDYYPTIFAEERADREEEELEIFKARRRSAMDVHNAMRNRQEVDIGE